MFGKCEFSSIEPYLHKKIRKGIAEIVDDKGKTIQM